MTPSAGGGSRVVLASLAVDGLAGLASLDRVVFVPTAANGLEDRAAVVDSYRAPLLQLGAGVEDLDLEEVDRVAPDALAGADVVFCSGGNPYRLLAASRRSGFDGLVRRAVAAGTTYVGASAGALVAGPSLDPVRAVSPFTRPDRFDGAGLAITGIVALPHDDRPGRRALHEQAQRDHGGALQLLGVADPELLVVEPGGGWWLLDQPSGRRIRPAAAGDAAGIAEAFVDAGRTAWDFVEAERSADFEAPVEAWHDRLAARVAVEDVLVVTDDEGIGGFVWVRESPDADLPEGTGELAAFYTRPRLWGRGSGRRLLTLGLDRLRAMGARDAVLFTEERNHRARRLYERSGWVLDGGHREREFLGVPIRELRYRRPL